MDFRFTDEQEMLRDKVGKFATYKRPKSIQFMDSLPESTVGKILRRELRKIG